PPTPAGLRPDAAAGDATVSFALPRCRLRWGMAAGHRSTAQGSRPRNSKGENPMIDLHRILVPTDFSKYSQTALTYAAAFAEKFGPELYLLHVVQALAVFIPAMLTVAPPLAPSVDQLSAAVREALDRLVRDNQLERFPVHKEVREGTPFYEIIRFAKETDV